jgi:hypothetical protein
LPSEQQLLLLLLLLLSEVLMLLLEMLHVSREQTSESALGAAAVLWR